MEENASRDSRHEPVFSSPPMQQLLRQVAAFADCEQPVVIEGATGVGKEYIALMLHKGHARRHQHAFVPVNCGAVPEGLFESLFFGHVRGAFTGALGQHKGFFEQADQGTLFLDEIGELPLHQQAKLLRVLEDGRVTRVGAEQPVATNVRLVAATHRGLRDMVRAKTFRADLYYRLAVVELKVPDLVERGREERLALFASMLDTGAGGPAPAWLLDSVAEADLPGNIRQLRNMAERVNALVRAYGDWPREMLEGQLGRDLPVAASAPVQGEARAARRRPDAAAEREEIRQALQQNAWNRQATAAQLGISRKTLWEKMRRHVL